MRILLTYKGSATSGWYAPPRGTHSGSKHRAVGSGKAVKPKAKPKAPVKVKPAEVPKPTVAEKPTAVGYTPIGAERAAVLPQSMFRAIDKNGNFKPLTPAKEAKIRKTLARHPEAALNGLSRWAGVQVPVNRAALIKEYRRVEPYAAPGIIQGWYTFKTNTITLGSMTPALLDHEMGHALWNAAGKTRVGRNVQHSWRRAYKANRIDKHTGYSATSSEEGFSEAYMAFIKTGGAAKSAKYIATFDMVRQVIDGAS